MLGNLSGGEMVILVIIALLVFGAGRLPEAGRAVGKGLREFRRALSEAQGALQRPPGDEPGRAERRPSRLSD